MSRSTDWHSFVDDEGRFEFPNYIYKTISELMKLSLDMGTLLSDDKAKLRAYKEQIKKEFKSRWFNIAQALEVFELAEPCGCDSREFCKECGGSRYKLNKALTADQIQEIGYIIGPLDDPKAIQELRNDLMDVIKDQTQGKNNE